MAPKAIIYFDSEQNQQMNDPSEKSVDDLDNLCRKINGKSK